LIAPTKLVAVQAILLKALQNAWDGATFTAGGIDDVAGRPDGLLDMLGTADSLAPTLASAANIGGNPRIIKRLLNAVMLRQSLAGVRKMKVNMGTLAKLAIFERGTDADATQALYTMVMSGQDDADLQLAAFDDLPKKTTRPALPKSWIPFEPFIEEWRNLEPRFNDAKLLQPALFLSRDVMASPASSRQGDKVADAIKALLAVNSAHSPAAKAVIDGLSADERLGAMAGVVASLREGDWSKPGGIHGAIMLAEASDAAKRQLRALVEGVPQGEMNKGTLYALRSKGYIGGK
jgi:hypothetical protein